MSKYIKLEDAIKAIEDKIADYIPVLYGRYGEIPLELRMAIEHLSTIEVSEDCISREYMKSLGYINKGNFNSVETIREWIDNAPSVVPSRAEGEPQTENIKVTCDMVGSKKEIEYQLPKCEKCINYGVEFTEDDSIDTCLIDECHYEPKDEQSSMVGEWIMREDWGGDNYYDCSVCGESFVLIDGTPSMNLYHYCPNCGAKMRLE